jgi:dihydrodipicolinate reductase
VRRRACTPRTPAVSSREAEIRFAHRGDTLTIGLSSHQRDGFAAGTLLAVKAVASRPGVTYGLAPLLGLDFSDGS